MIFEISVCQIFKKNYPLNIFFVGIEIKYVNIVNMIIFKQYTNLNNY